MKNAALGLALTIPCWLLILVGWGLGDREAFFSSWERAIALASLWPMFWAGIAAGIKLSGPAHAESKAQAVIPVFVTGGFALGMFALPRWDRMGSPAWLILGQPEVVRPLGLALMLAGLGVASWALLTLRRFFSPRIMVQKDHQLVRRGPYRWIRHPFYLGLSLLALGFPLVFRSWLGFPVLVLFFPAVAWRMTIEEKLLGDAFGSAYDEYKKTSWRLLPHV